MLNHYIWISKGICTLFGPLAEVVIHDLSTNKIVFIEGKEQVRSVGDSSCLSKKERELTSGILGPYFKTAYDGSLQKSVSIVFEENQKKNRYMMCINFEIAQFKEIENFLKLFTGQAETKNQQDYFEDNWQDKIHKYISAYLSKQSKLISSLSREEKKELITDLYSKGAFETKNAASYIAKILKISRASVYSYLKE